MIIPSYLHSLAFVKDKTPTTDIVYLVKYGGQFDSATIHSETEWIAASINNQPNLFVSSPTTLPPTVTAAPPKPSATTPGENPVDVRTLLEKLSIGEQVGVFGAAGIVCSLLVLAGIVVVKRKLKSRESRTNKTPSQQQIYTI